LWLGLAVTLVATLLSLILRCPKAITFVNRSSLSQIYSARLGRAYLGASNPLRQRPDGANITEVIAGDDLPSIREYKPHEVGGPFHLINLVVNQTVDFSSLRGNRDRQGESFAVSSVGVSIGTHWHSKWTNACDVDTSTEAAKRSRLKAVGHVPGDSHPLLDETGQPAPRAEMLSLRQWMGISGAAVGPGRGQNTSLGTALLFGLTNIRTGHWWNSGITEADREGFPKLTFLRRLLVLIPDFFLPQSLLVREWIARFSGPWSQFWNLSDGGFFENTGAYELVRRRVPRLIICDGSADPTYSFESFAEFVRKVRIDFDAQVKPFRNDELDLHVPDGVRAYLGEPDDLKPGSETRKHAALYWIDYPPRRSTDRQRSVLLYLKASISGDEDDDVRNYYEMHREFPHEATADQIFNEAQWESYRKLGQHIAGPLAPDAATPEHLWLWAIPLA
jgi:hypothetical protein